MSRLPSSRVATGLASIVGTMLALGDPTSAQAVDHQPGFIEVWTAGNVFFRHQPIRVRLRIGIERRLARDHLVQVFRTRLDLPLQVDASWLTGLPGATVLPRRRVASSQASSLAGSSVSIAVNGRIMRAKRCADETRDGRLFTVVEIEEYFLPERLGELSIPAPQVRFCVASSFREDLLRGRMPVDQQTRLLTGVSVALRVRALPRDVRPANFTGAVGRFRFTAHATPTELDPDSPLSLTLRIAGEGNLGSFDLPSPIDLPGFHVGGVIERPIAGTGAHAREVIYELTPLSAGVDMVPAIAFTYFELGQPGEGRYRTIRTAPITIVVRGATSATDRRSAGGPTTGTPGLDDIFDLRLPATPASPSTTAAPSTIDSPSPYLLLLASGLPWLLTFGLRSLLRHRAHHTAPGRRRERGAAATFRTTVASNPTAVGDALVEYLAARLHCPRAAVIGPDLTNRLQAHGVPTELATRTAELIHTLFAARYGGTEPPEAADEATTLVQSLEKATHLNPD